MPETAWKFATNTFLSITDRRIPLMSEILHDHQPKLALAATTEPSLSTVSTETTALLTQWETAEQGVVNTEAGKLSATAAFEDKLASLARKPDIDTNSPLESWDSTIRASVPYQGTIYLLLLPRGRETLTNGSYQERIDAIEGLATRLTQQVSKPTLVSLGILVLAFRNALNTLWNAHNSAENTHTAARAAIDTLRVTAARQLFRNVGAAMMVWNSEINLPKIEALFDMALVRGDAQEPPAAPADTIWTPATRTLSTSAMPAGATTLIAMRQGPGAAPEMLARGARGALTVVIPAEYTFDHGDLYQLWLEGNNGAGPSGPGPKQSWTAP